MLNKNIAQGAYQQGFDCAYASVSWNGRDFYLGCTMRDLDKIMRIKLEGYEDYGELERERFRRGFLDCIRQEILQVHKN